MESLVTQPLVEVNEEEEEEESGSPTNDSNKSKPEETDSAATPVLVPAASAVSFPKVQLVVKKETREIGVQVDYKELRNWAEIKAEEEAQQKETKADFKEESIDKPSFTIGHASTESLDKKDESEKEDNSQPPPKVVLRRASTVTPVRKEEEGAKDKPAENSGSTKSDNAVRPPLKRAQSDTHFDKEDSSTAIRKDSASSVTSNRSSDLESKSGLSRTASDSRFGSRDSGTDGRAFSHASTMGEDKKRNVAWKNELAKFQLQRRVSELIGTFDKDGEETTMTPEEVKQRRRGSLQIEAELSKLSQDLGTEDKSSNDSKSLKQLRRKSTSAIFTNPMGDMNILNLTDILIDASTSAQKAADGEAEKEDEVKEESTEGDDPEAEKVKEEKEEAEKETPVAVPSPVLKRSTSDGPRSWDYFEIDHPKAISERKLQQLKAKYQRRKTESTIKEEDERNDSSASSKDDPSGKHGVPLRSSSVPLIKAGQPTGINKPKELGLSIDPLTGQCLDASASSLSSVSSVSIVSVADSEASSTSSEDCSSNGNSSASRKSSRGSTAARRRSSNLPDIAETSTLNSANSSAIPEEKILEVRIDPLTGKMETIEVTKSKGAAGKGKKLSVDIAASAAAGSSSCDDGFGSLPMTPTTDNEQSNNLSNEKQDKNGEES